MESIHSAPLELLPALVALLETESVTESARRLHVGQPAMSRTLEKLRVALGDALLVREGRRLVRTRRGDALMPDASALLAEAQRLLAPPSAFDPALAQGVVTVALGDDMQALLAGALLGRLRAEAPGLDVRVRPLTLATLRDAHRGRVEVAVLPDMRGQGTLPGLEDLVLRPLYARRFVTVSRARRRLDLARFLAVEHVLVSPAGEEGGFVDDALRAQGRARRVAVAVPSFLSALALVEQSDLVSTLPDDVVRGLAPALHCQPCPVPTPQLPMCVAWPPRFGQDPRHRWLREHVAEALRGCGP